MNVITDPAKIDVFLDRAVEKVFPARDYLKARLLEGKPLTMYLGIDPTGPTLHLGTAIVLMKLREFQDLGHKIILLIGDFTAMIGDPTDKSATRVRLTREQVLANATNYKKQASKILNFSGENKAELKYNSKWLAKMGLEQFIEVLSHTTLQQIEVRDMFTKRKEEGKPVFNHEFVYPILQGYDSVAMDVDGEIGGNDQTFNMLVGRDLLKSMKGKEKFVMATKLLVDPTGKKMGKSEGNMITLADAPEEMYGKIMSWSDGMIVPGFEILTRLPIEAEKAVANPRDEKARLAEEVVAFFHSRAKAKAAKKAFNALFQEHEMPTDIPTLPVSASISVIDALVKSGLVTSNGEAKRLIDGGGVKVDGTVVVGYDMSIAPTAAGVVVQKGKRHFVRVIQG